jgi:hypothetical protein
MIADQVLAGIENVSRFYLFIKKRGWGSEDVDNKSLAGNA